MLGMHAVTYLFLSARWPRVIFVLFLACDVC